MALAHARDGPTYVHTFLPIVDECGDKLGKAMSARSVAWRTAPVTVSLKWIRPIQNEEPDNTGLFQNSVLLVLGLALIGAASIVLGFAGGSAPGLAIGAGVVLAAGAISIFNAVSRSLVRFESNFKGVISRRNSSRARHMPVPTEPSAPAHGGAREAKTLFEHGTSPVRPGELFQADRL